MLALHTHGIERLCRTQIGPNYGTQRSNIKNIRHNFMLKGQLT